MGGTRWSILWVNSGLVSRLVHLDCMHALLSDSWLTGVPAMMESGECRLKFEWNQVTALTHASSGSRLGTMLELLPVRTDST